MTAISPSKLDDFLQNAPQILGNRWALQQGKLFIALQFASFAQAFSAMTAIALHAEKVNHHPEWRNNHAVLEITLYTYDNSCITQKDLDMANAIAQLLSIYPQPASSSPKND